MELALQIDALLYYPSTYRTGSFDFLIMTLGHWQVGPVMVSQVYMVTEIQGSIQGGVRAKRRSIQRAYLFY
jgi:hypothetical protein